MAKDDKKEQKRQLEQLMEQLVELTGEAKLQYDFNMSRLPGIERAIRHAIAHDDIDLAERKIREYGDALESAINASKMVDRTSRQARGIKGRLDRLKSWRRK